ncbi:integral membrane protein [Mycolicibacterium rhodesiae JS60]|nr:integral membrane protein [Mycolicibacterium rhodesiae JS60]
MLAWGALTLLVGVLILRWPGKSILVASILFGAYVIASGIPQAIFAFLLDTSGGERVLLFISGALSVVLGALAFRHYQAGWPIVLLAIWISVGSSFRGWPSQGWPSALTVC